MIINQLGVTGIRLPPLVLCCTTGHGIQLCIITCKQLLALAESAQASRILVLQFYCDHARHMSHQSQGAHACPLHNIQPPAPLQKALTTRLMSRPGYPPTYPCLWAVGNTGLCILRLQRTQGIHAMLIGHDRCTVQVLGDVLQFNAPPPS